MCSKFRRVCHNNVLDTNETRKRARTMTKTLNFTKSHTFQGINFLDRITKTTAENKLFIVQHSAMAVEALGAMTAMEASANNRCIVKITIPKPQLLSYCFRVLCEMNDSCWFYFPAVFYLFQNVWVNRKPAKYSSSDSWWLSHTLPSVCKEYAISTNKSADNFRTFHVSIVL